MFWREVYCSIGYLIFEFGDVNSSSVIHVFFTGKLCGYEVRSF